MWRRKGTFPHSPILCGGVLQLPLKIYQLAFNYFPFCHVITTAEEVQPIRLYLTARVLS
jgi:hypothetical protein